MHFNKCCVLPEPSLQNSLNDSKRRRFHPPPALQKRTGSAAIPLYNVTDGPLTAYLAMDASQQGVRSMRNAVIILAVAMSTMLSGCASQRQARKDRRVTPALKETPDRKDRLDPPDHKVCKALQDRREPLRSSASFAHPARALKNAR